MFPAAREFMVCPSCPKGSDAVADIIWIATLGARICTAAHRSRSIGFVVQAGSDFPPSIEAILRDWQIRLIVQKDVATDSTRGLLQYQDSSFDARTFSYTNSLLTVSPDMLFGAGLLEAQILHFFDSPSDLVRKIRRIEEIIDRHPIKAAFIMWEPAPSYCTPKHLDIVYRAVRFVDIFSPNHIELLSLFGQPQGPRLDRGRLEAIALEFMDKSFSPAGMVSMIVRAGEHGCLVCVSSPKKLLAWIPPFYNAGTYGADRDVVVDTTGAGNAFLGAFAVGFRQNLDIIEAAQWGTIAASFALEQIGLPKLARDSNGRELWNGTSFTDRLRAYQARQNEGSRYALLRSTSMESTGKSLK